MSRGMRDICFTSREWARGVLYKVLYEGAPPLALTPYPFVYHFDRKVTHFV